MLIIGGLMAIRVWKIVFQMLAVKYLHTLKLGKELVCFQSMQLLAYELWIW